MTAVEVTGSVPHVLRCNAAAPERFMPAPGCSAPARYGYGR
jgi:hypothetical protein